LGRPKLSNSDAVAPDVEEGKPRGCAVLDKREDLETVKTIWHIHFVTLEAISVCWPRSKDG